MLACRGSMNVARAAQDVDRSDMAFACGILLYSFLLSVFPPAMSQSPPLVPIPLLSPPYPASPHLSVHTSWVLQ